MDYRKCRKKLPTEARKLTREDYVAYGGVIQTPEGPCKFRVGGWLCRDRKGQWPITARNVRAHYRIGGHTEDGWTLLFSKDIREAKQEEQPFEAGGLRGKAWDYRLCNPQGDEWPVDRELYEETYEWVA